MPLTDTAARQAKFTNKQQKISDEKGLYLLVNASGKYWRLKYRFAGKEKVLAFGVYPEVSLKEARTKRDEARKLIAEGADPGVTRKQEKIAKLAASENSLESLAREWHQSQLARWSKGHAARVLESLEADVFPDLGSLPAIRKMQHHCPRFGTSSPPFSYLDLLTGTTTGTALAIWLVIEGQITTGRHFLCCRMAGGRSAKAATQTKSPGYVLMWGGCKPLGVGDSNHSSAYLA